MSLMVFDLGGTSVKYGKYDKDNIVDKGFFKTPTSLNDLIVAMKKAMAPHENIEGVAISSPGAVNQEERRIEGISAIPYIHATPIFDAFEEAFSLPVAIENDANCAGLCEVEMGAAKNGQNIVFMVLGTGMGGSIFIDRKLHAGSHLFGGEFGMSLNTNGKTGSENGTLVATAHKYNERTGKNVDGIELLTLYDEGEEVAVEVINAMYDYIAEALYNVQVIVDPDLVVLGGGISNRQTLPKELSERMDVLLENIDVLGAKPKIVNADFKNDANLLGAVINYKKQNI